MANSTLPQKQTGNKFYGFLFKSIDNAPLIVFRIIFGFLLMCHCVKAFTSGFILRNLITPKFTFSHIGMDWLQPLPGNGMYFYYAAMAVCGILISVGLFYRYSLMAFTILWAGVYFMQKTIYNNHYYLLLLICIIMLFMPANENHSIDSKINPQIKSNYMPAWCSWVMIFQIGIVYTFAAIAKMYPDWLDGTYTTLVLEKSKSVWLQELYHQKWLHYFIAYAGLLFDLLIVPLLLWRRTRIFMFVAAVFFHLFNNVTFDIGIFPFFALSFCVFFFEPETIRKIFFRNAIPEDIIPYSSFGRRSVLWFFIPYFFIQLILPIRHYFIKGDVLWTDEGHRLSWRMMLRNRAGTIKFIVEDHETGKRKTFKLVKILTKRQIKMMRTKPDMIWQTAQRINEYYQKKGKTVSIYIDSKVSINKKPAKVLIDPNTDFATAKWNYFGHNDWILLYED